jgi:hypothetical protein
MNEAETRADHIDPALKAAGWGDVEGSRIHREYPITLGRIEGHGKRGKALTADYVLVYRTHKLAVIEAKAWDEALTEGTVFLLFRRPFFGSTRAASTAWRSERQGKGSGRRCAIVWYPLHVEHVSRTLYPLTSQFYGPPSVRTSLCLSRAAAPAGHNFLRYSEVRNRFDFLLRFAW